MGRSQPACLCVSGDSGAGKNTLVCGSAHPQTAGMCAMKNSFPPFYPDSELRLPAGYSESPYGEGGLHV